MIEVTILISPEPVVLTQLGVIHLEEVAVNIAGLGQVTVTLTPGRVPLTLMATEHSRGTKKSAGYKRCCGPVLD